MKYGNYAIIDGAEHFLEKEPQWYWKFRPASSGDELARAKFFTRNGTLITNELGQQVEVPPLQIEVMHYELALLFGGTNIPKDPDKPVEEGGKPILEVGASVAQVMAEVERMPSGLVRELWLAMGEAVPFWGASKEPQEETDQSEEE